MLELSRILLPVGFTIFFILFFQVFNYHDYYLSNWTIIFPFFLISALLLCKRYFHHIFISKYLRNILVFVFIYSMYYGAALTRTKYFSDDFFANEYFNFGRVRRVYFRGEHEKYNRTIAGCETVEPYLRSLGIKREDKVISMPDFSINISLVLMDQKGFTDFGFSESGVERINKFIRMGAKYIIINDRIDCDTREYLKPFLKHKIGVYKNIDIYELSSLNKK